MDWSRFLPPVPADYRGSRIAYDILVLITVVSTVRSLIHVVAPDGGAGSIAGLAVDVEGGTNLIAIFAQWGASQLMLAILMWVVVLRYRFLVPLMLAIVALEQALRIAVVLLKPLQVATPSPGAVGSYVILPLALIALLLSLHRVPEAG